MSRRWDTVAPHMALPLTWDTVAPQTALSLTRIIFRMYTCQARTFGNVQALGHRRAADGAVAYAMQTSMPLR